ncbi:hypothetical protein [Cytophaga hutchinsonii]|jgi:drug/metabolite transporter (DMT)-like permease|uniref:Uncharacterized protein n=1 Tax=Cytophaga hutchinsonii (strain ATCC 33406 / DSM 1761 / CIP 103989 / NBRC 15051 / NCIMB 9469 / D465) TaxID=269798 RepID=A0A6N4SST6_CYTH3|nr:hypothetical protein [Cytophaga hutchinsonii]ABG59275.1 hypothetical protein CHU_2009 [Cytophaga hutchinsonii ATCC 33406]SFX32829.1 hypothetical protein SAMN04487930_10331 [Cytophaga hutchinsonii ATCC 33406]
MIEIILVIYLCIQISKLAVQKEQPKNRWVFMTVLFWFLGETFAIGLFVSISGIQITAENINDPDIMGSLFGMLFAGCCGGFLGYLLVRKKLESIPDQPYD